MTMNREDFDKPKQIFGEMAARTEDRTCFSIAYYPSEEEAGKAGSQVRLAGRTYNGGFFHGESCGREPARDYETKNGERRFAVTF